MQNFTHKSQTATIFEKTLQLPPRLPGLPPTGQQAGSILKQPEASLGGTTTIPYKSNGQNSSRNADKPQTGLKRQLMSSTGLEEGGFLNYDLNLCSNQIEL